MEIISNSYLSPYFSGYPKTTSLGDIFGSDKAAKYPMKNMWKNQGEKVIYIKSFKLDKSKNGEIKLRPKSLKERYEELFEIKDLKKEKNSRAILKNLFDAVDVKQFGATFAEEGNNISIMGAVQIGQGFNKYEYSEIQEQQVLSPFRDGKSKEKSKDNEEASATTIGTKIVVDEAHYFYPFTINPLEYKEYIDMGVTDGYTERDYMKFKEASLCAATAFNSNSKSGCENEFAMFVETDIELYLPNLTKYVTFDKQEKNNISIKLGHLLNDIQDNINSIEIYYNPYTTTINSDINEVKYFNIYTRKEV